MKKKEQEPKELKDKRGKKKKRKKTDKKKAMTPVNQSVSQSTYLGTLEKEVHIPYVPTLHLQAKNPRRIQDRKRKRKKKKKGQS